ncbi:MAG: hypothetical protein A2V70_12090 [Planctomycetes bacterium RBG_13_63_9]|nr:MAG: hypothetical protein A2V70_12090 [Planctomycetes bacterium RBG_13_63_9]
MRKTSVALGAVFVLCAMLVTNASCVEIMISPSTIVIGGEQTCVTVHADIPYIAVAGGVTLTVEGGGVVSASSLKADDCGDLVAKFSHADVVAAIGERRGEVSMTLSGATTIGGSFSGTDTVVVKQKLEKR